MYPLGFTYHHSQQHIQVYPCYTSALNPFTNYCKAPSVFTVVSILYNVEKNILAHVFSILLSFKRASLSQWNQWTRSGWLTELSHTCYLPVSLIKSGKYLCSRLLLEMLPRGAYEVPMVFSTSDFHHWLWLWDQCSEIC